MADLSNNQGVFSRLQHAEPARAPLPRVQDKIKLLPCLCNNCKRGSECQQLPLVSTCFFTLRLPGADSKEEMDRRLRLAMEYGAIGFGAV